MHSIASSRLVSSSGGFRDRPSCLSTGCLSSELPAAHRRRVLLLLSFRALLGSLLSPFGSFLCPFGSLLSPFGSYLYAKSTARCTSQTGRSRVCHVRVCVSWWCMCMMLLSRSRVWSAENLVWFCTFFLTKHFIFISGFFISLLFIFIHCRYRPV